MTAHDVDEAGKLGRLFAARGHDRDQGGGFDFRHVAGEDLLEDCGRLLTREGRSIFSQRTEEFLYQRHKKSMADGGRFQVAGCGSLCWKNSLAYPILNACAFRMGHPAGSEKRRVQRFRGAL